MSVKEIRYALSQLADSERAQSSQRFFKTGPGEYGEGDVFLGIPVPLQRQVARRFSNTITLGDIETLLDDVEHEHRLTALFLLVSNFERQLRKRNPEAETCVNLYLKKLYRVNNWDLVDSSAHLILGRWLEDKDPQILYDLAKNENLWYNRVAMVSTLYFIRKGNCEIVFEIARLLVANPHDLIHKAVGWMLREAWKKDPNSVEVFLQEHGASMPRTMLRYAIEKMGNNQRIAYLELGQLRSKRR
jgi:3-methyladenine DNA glycosylase AlkD